MKALHPLPDERPGQRPGAAARRPDHRATRRSPGSPPASTSATGRAAAHQGHRRRADHRPRQSMRSRRRRTSCSPTTRCSTSCCCAQADATIWAESATVAAVPRARRVPHLRRRAGHRRRDAAAPARPRPEEPLGRRRPRSPHEDRAARSGGSPRSPPRRRSGTRATRRPCSASPRPSSVSRSAPDAVVTESRLDLDEWVGRRRGRPRGPSCRREAAPDLVDRRCAGARAACRRTARRRTAGRGRAGSARSPRRADDAARPVRRARRPSADLLPAAHPGQGAPVTSQALATPSPACDVARRRWQLLFPARTPPARATADRSCRTLVAVLSHVRARRTAGRCCRSSCTCGSAS